MLEKLKEEVFQANLDLVKYGLVIFTWGNASGISRENGLVVIKPSGISYEKMKPKDMVVLNLYGQVMEGNLKPSSDAPTHLVLYRQFQNIGGVVHTHSEWATSWAQAGKGIPAIGTTHADYFYGEIPCTRKMRKEEIEKEYELETGKVIVERFNGLNPESIPGVLVNNHGPFSWGTDVHNAVHNAVVMEEVAKMAFRSFVLNPKTTMDKVLLDKHFLRKHGKDAYYGQ
ncbi:L-ribulose-5-phosphate 4-epimerase [Maribellus sp. CM-23]|uniref:L-ribulose-5-phosphate 4-epimerase n=1 Tax=Maribellus sp. CM-23 TaxID=2781026 RepID=UPI001F178F7D|nr:L-ribulose-5-phosphate 4-epimerase [Maribellus sp. CM-23]MCE4565180.1 L-ribulose-5-phosphate 4-epimerase [Maribellus sp. CM-23]